MCMLLCSPVCHPVRIPYGGNQGDQLLSVGRGKKQTTATRILIPALARDFKLLVPVRDKEGPILQSKISDISLGTYTVLLKPISG